MVHAVCGLVVVQAFLICVSLCIKVIQARQVVPGEGKERGGTEMPRVRGQSLRTHRHIHLHDITQDTGLGMVDRRLMIMDIM